LEVDKLYFTPCVPPEWNGFQVHYRYRETIYHIDVLQAPGSEATTAITMDGVGLELAFVPLVDDGIEHYVQVMASIPG
jgi:cellobiose phosphorylase